MWLWRVIQHWLNILSITSVAYDIYITAYEHSADYTICIQKLKHLELPGLEVNYSYIFYDAIEALDKRQMSRIFLQVVSSVLFTLELAHKSM